MPNYIENVLGWGARVPYNEEWGDKLDSDLQLLDANNVEYVNTVTEADDYDDEHVEHFFLTKNYYVKNFQMSLVPQWFNSVTELRDERTQICHVLDKLGIEESDVEFGWFSIITE